MARARALRARSRSPKVEGFPRSRSSSACSRVLPARWAVVAVAAAVASLGALSRSGADDRFTVLALEAERGDREVPVLIAGSNSLEVHGYSVAVSFPRRALIARQFDVEGTHVAALEPEFVAGRIDQDAGVATLAVILNYTPFETPKALPPLPDAAPPRIIARLIADVRGDAPGGRHSILLADGVGERAVFNRWTSAGASVVPWLDDGTLYIPGPNQIAIESRIAFAGISTPSLTLFASARHDEPLAGYAVAINYECAHIDLLGADLVQTTVEAELGRRGLIDFFVTDIDDTVGAGLCRSRTAVVFEYPKLFEKLECPLPTLAPENQLGRQTLVRYRFRVHASASNGVAYRSLSFANLGSTALNTTLLVDRCPDGPESILPESIDGRIYFSTGGFRGRVTDAMTGLPVAGATVRTAPEVFSAQTRADGTFEIAQLVPGRYRFHVDKPGYYSRVFPEREARGGKRLDETGSLAIYTIPEPTIVEGGAGFRRGDGNADGTVDLSDGIFVLNYLFLGRSIPGCFDAVDSDDSGTLNITDGVLVFLFLFSGGEAPPAPGPFRCGEDASPDPLSCLVHATCAAIP